MPNEKSRLEERKFVFLDSTDISQIDQDDFLCGVTSVVFSQATGDPNSLIRELEKFTPRLLNFGCLVIVLVNSPGGLSRVKNVLKEGQIPGVWPRTDQKGYESFDGKTPSLEFAGAPRTPHVVVRMAPNPIHDIEDLLVRHIQHPKPASKTSGQFKITGPAVPGVTPERELLFRRGFHDCSELHLSLLPGGNSAGVSVYIAHAVIGAHGRSLPFFVKVGPLTSILKEWENYENRVRPSIPFHLAPHLLPDRCVLGAHEGIIVGDFVEDSESLTDCVRCGRAVSVVGNLFDRTLSGWQRQASRTIDHLNTRLSGLIRGQVNKSRLEKAMKFGAERTPEKLTSIMQRRVEEPLLVGPIHGDLHAGNVRVRGADAILIDFYSARDGLLLANCAALEVSLVVRAPGEWNQSAGMVEWGRMVKTLYTKVALHDLPPFPDPTEPFAWISTSVRQIRLRAFSMQLKESQYAQVLAYYFLQAAIKDPKPKATESEDDRRAFAYCVADGLVAQTGV